ncbi:MAG: ABC transporter ATP-binding protein [Solirubrobacterales bacterium]|nr:ABC transporter ATP-binding protein [Solirubrobacterales bacterium]
MPAVIEVEGLEKQFGHTRALDGLDLTVQPGEVHGFLGPNGSGKSTTIRVLLGLIRASGGRAAIFGQDPWTRAREVTKRVAYVPGDIHLWPNLTGGETIDVLGSLRGGLDPARVSELCERFELDTAKKSKAYSKGNRQKVALIAALASDAELFIFDEPTSGLDPLKEAVFQDCVAEIRKAEKTILLSSHILGQVERLVDRLTIIREGRTVESGSLGELRHLTRTSIRAETATPPDGIESLTGLHGLRRDGNQVSFSIDTAELRNTMEWLAGRGVVSLVSRPPTLEDLFLHEYEDG